MNRLRELRLEKGLLQSDIAKIIGKKDRIIGFYESGERDPSTETLSILADFFDVSIDYLLGKSNVRNPKQEDDPLGLANIGFSMKNYKPPTETQKDQIRDMIKIILKDNKIDEGENND